MLTESPSDNTRMQPSGAKRIRLDEVSPSNKASDKAIPPTGGKTPLEAAMAAAITYVEMLHKKLQPFLTDLIQKVLKDASAYHYKSEKLKDMIAIPEYVPAICRTVGMKLQAASEVTKSTGFKALEGELVEVIMAMRRDWATCFVFPVQDLNVKALRKRFQLSYCRLLSLAAKGFIVQVGTKGYDTNVAIMNLLAMHGNEIVAPLNVVLLKEAAGMTIIPSPTVNHSMTELLNKINGMSPPGGRGRGQVNGSSTMTDATRAAAAAAATLFAEQLTAAESAVTQATSQLELMPALIDQAHAGANEATRCRATSHETLAVARRARATAIDTVDVAIADEAHCIAVGGPAQDLSKFQMAPIPILSVLTCSTS